MKSIYLLSTLMASLGALAAPLPADTANPDGLCTIGTSSFGCTRPVTKKRWIWTWSPEQEDTVADVTERSGVTPDGYRTVGSSALGCTRPVNK